MRMKNFAVIGYPIEHSLSPVLWSTVFRKIGFEGNYTSFKVSKIMFSKKMEALKELGFFAVQLTIPLKEVALDWSQKATPEAIKAGAANCLKLETGLAHNSDIYGITLSLGSLPKSKRIILLGTGGASRAVLACPAVQNKEIIIVSRSPQKAEALLESFQFSKKAVLSYENLNSLVGIKDSLLINATPMGLLEGSEVPEGIKKQMKSFVGVLDMVYLKEGKTELCNLAEQEGLPHLDGKLMLAAQAQEGFYFFTGQKEPVELFLDSLMEALKKESNDG